MDKKTILVVALLFVFMFTWAKIDRKLIRPLFPEKETTAVEAVEAASGPADTELSENSEQSEAVADEDVVPAVDTAKKPEQNQVKATIPAPVKESLLAETMPDVEEEQWLLSNDFVEITFSSYGACVNEVVLKQYEELNEPESPLIKLDFSGQPALRYKKVSGFDGNAVFSLVEQTDNSLVLQRKNAGITLTRTIALEKQYELKVTDQFKNSGETPFSCPQNRIQLGPMQRLPGRAMRGLTTLGIDVLSPGAVNTTRYGKELQKLFKNNRIHDEIYPRSVVEFKQIPLDWLAVKNKYFVQIVFPENGGTACEVEATRKLTDAELLSDVDSAAKFTELTSVGATIILPELLIEPGDEQTRTISCYIGPKKYELLSQLGFHQEAVMEFATTMPVFNSMNFFMVPIKVGILWLLNFIHDYIWPHSYGLAIILITILMRIVFWPVTHKSTESMKRMQELQPLIKEIRAKYKDDQQKMQQATMALYKEHKVNPVSGCLPMLIQIPVFFALFAVLRAAIELRFAPFLWVTDLSQPENLLAGVLPIPLNILPLIMVATQFIQQKMTPTSADPQQAKMMQFMPLMFLFIFYNMPAGLVLYWTTNQCLMIIQQLLSRRKKL